MKYIKKIDIQTSVYFQETWSRAFGGKGVNNMVYKQNTAVLLLTSVHGSSL